MYIVIRKGEEGKQELLAANLSEDVARNMVAAGDPEERRTAIRDTDGITIAGPGLLGHRKNGRTALARAREEARAKKKAA